MANLSLFFTFFKYCSPSPELRHSPAYIRPHIVSHHISSGKNPFLLEEKRFKKKRMEESKVTESKVTVMKRSMSDEVFDEAMKLTANAFASQENDKDIAEHIKTQLEKKFHGSWYVVFFFLLTSVRACR